VDAVSYGSRISGAVIMDEVFSKNDKCLTSFIFSSFRKFPFTPETENICGADLATNEEGQVCETDNIEKCIENSPFYESLEHERE
jgi:hypothetical protein